MLSLGCGMRKAKDTITAIGTANSTQNNPMIQPQNIMHTNTSRGLTHRDFPMITGTRNFSSHCWIIVYKIIIANTPHRPENISADIAAGKAQSHGHKYGIISNNPAISANVHFWGMLTQKSSKIRNHK